MEAGGGGGKKNMNVPSRKWPGPKKSLGKGAATQLCVGSRKEERFKTHGIRGGGVTWEEGGGWVVERVW